MKIKPITEKPKMPQEPQCSDKVKYPNTHKIKNFLGHPIWAANENYIQDYRKYQKDMERYKLDLEIYEQTKLIKLVKNADIKLILRKYRITKIA